MPSYGPNAQLALDVILGRPATGVPSWLLNPMDHAHIERVAGTPPGSYARAPVETYLAFQRQAGTCMLDQYIPENPLTMGPTGFEGAEHGATTGASYVVLDGIRIDSPEAVAEHLEQVAFPGLYEAARTFDEDAHTAGILAHERAVQEVLGADILKAGHGWVAFPGLDYMRYGYGPYFMACALYPDVIERHFALQAALAALQNRAAVRAYRDGGLPPFHRLDHDMADSRGTLNGIGWLHRHWFPHFACSIEPLVRAGIRLVWHCDGNLMQMVPRLLECGVSGFQGFQYEDGMDYERICRMRTRDGGPLLIIAGASVTRTLPFGTPDDVRRELAWLVEHGPRGSLFLGASSSIAPGVPWENMQALVEGLRWHRANGQPSTQRT